MAGTRIARRRLCRLPKVEKDREIPGCRVKSSIGGRHRFYNPLFDAVRPEIDRIA